jgi:hypothetical protein
MLTERAATALGGRAFEGHPACSLVNTQHPTPNPPTLHNEPKYIYIYKKERKWATHRQIIGTIPIVEKKATARRG